MTRRLAVALGLLALAVLGLFIHSLCNPHCRSGEIPVRSRLMMLGELQEDWRDCDRDGNDTEDYWRRDLSGLFLLYGELRQQGKVGFAPHWSTAYDAAAAEDRRPESDGLPKREAWGGYWLRPLKFEGEGAPDPDRFAVCAFPARYPESGKDTFLLLYGRRIYRKDLGRGGGVEACPEDPVKSGWTLAVDGWTFWTREVPQGESIR